MMNRPHQSISPRLTLLLILLPLLGTIVILRLYLHLVRVQHIYPAGFLIHHLFTGVLLIIPAAFVIAFGTIRKSTGISARIVLGIGSGLVLDEITFLVMTKASDADYLSPVSWFGSISFTVLAVILLWTLYRRSGP